MESVPLVILGSSRKNGDTHCFLKYIFEEMPFKLIDLLDYSISHYDYEHNYSADDQFELIIKEVLKQGGTEASDHCTRNSCLLV